MKKYLSAAVALMAAGAVCCHAGPVVKGKVTCGGAPLAGVVVSDGLNCVRTDADGCYSIEPDDFSTHVFVSVPSGYLPQMKDATTPCFWKRTCEIDGDCDFELRRNTVDDSRHLFYVQADVQMTSGHDLRQYRKVIRDMLEHKSGVEGMDVFGLDCGDIVGDTPSLYPDYLEAVACLDMPVYRAIGNHDMDYYGRSFETSGKTFSGYFGPLCYSFNKGQVHYIVLNDNFYIGREYFYMGYVDERTFRWLVNDLGNVPEGSMVIVLAHIPTRLTPDIRPFVYDYGTIADQVVNAEAVHRVFERYDTHIISGHMHYNLNICHADNMMEHNTASVCGTWWCSDVCLDGTPSGYAIYKVDGGSIEWIYKGVGHPESYQCKAYLPGACTDHPSDIIANVWNYDPLWTVEWTEDGKVMGAMEKYTGYDPYSRMMCSDKSKIKYDWIGPVPTGHLFKAEPRNKSAEIGIKITDRFGNVFYEPAVEFIYE